jgi:Ca-activated chloride channel homolog
MKNLRAPILHTLLLLCVICQATASAAQTLGDPVATRSAEALEQYRQGDFEEALRIYRDALVQRPGSPSLHLNVGDALYELGDYAAAADEFERAAGAPDEGLAAQGYYNLGNSHYQQQDFSAAAEAYREALQRTPQDQDAKANLELALQMLQSPPPQQQQGDGEQNDDDPKGDEQESGEQQQQQEQSDAGESSDPQDPNEKSQDPPSENQQPQDGQPEQESPPKPSQPDDSQESESEPDQTLDEAELDSDERMDEQEAEQLLDALGDREEEGQKRRFRVSRRGSQERDW